MRVILILLLICLAMESHANEESMLDQMSDYEQGHVLRLLHKRGWQVESNTEGKTVSFVDIFRYPVFVEFESLPLFPNKIHVLSQTSFIRREVIPQKGDVFSRSDLAETVRNLRGLGVFNLVAAVPIKTEEPDTVGVLIVTRDLWSLRLESAFQVTGTVVDRLQAQLTERNLFGRGIQALVRYNLQPLYFSTGALFSNRRLMGKPYMLTVASDMFFDRASGNYEGYSVSLYTGRPFYRRNDRYSYGVSAARGSGVVRQEQMGARAYWDDSETDDEEAVPRGWSYESYSLSLSGDLQFRSDYVYRVGGGASLSQYQAEVLRSLEYDSLAPLAQVRFNDQVVPESLLLAYPHTRFSFYRDRFSVFRNLSGFGLSEELQLGLSGGGYAQFPTQIMGSTQDLVITGFRLVYRERFLSDALFETAGASSQRYRFENGRWTDKTHLLRLRLASPTYRLGRMVFRSDYVGQRDQLVADPLSLGGDNGLRGYSSQRFLSFGGQRIRANVEYRSRPTRFGPMYLGAVLFYDGGSLYGGTENSGYVHSAGIGARGVMPQTSAYTYRIDFGLPLDGSGFMVMLKGSTMTIETNQAVPITPKDDVLYGGGVGGLGNQP